MSKRYFKRDDIVGRDVISDGAIRLGKVKDIGYDQNGRMVLIYDDQEGREEAIQSSQIIAIGDVILVRSERVEGASTRPEEGKESMKYCPRCGRANKPDMLYCTGCGARLEA